jgi:hypothetical protein
MGGGIHLILAHFAVLIYRTIIDVEVEASAAYLRQEGGNIVLDDPRIKTLQNGVGLQGSKVADLVSETEEDGNSTLTVLESKSKIDYTKINASVGTNSKFEKTSEALNRIYKASSRGRGFAPINRYIIRYTEEGQIYPYEIRDGFLYKNSEQVTFDGIEIEMKLLP